MDKFDFPLNKSKILFLCLGSVFLFVSCLYVQLSINDISTLMQVLLMVAAVASMVELIRLIMLLRSKDQPLLSITESGIYCNMSNPPISLTWNEIEKLAIIRRNGRKNLAILVKEPAIYLTKYNTRTFKSNFDDMNTPFLINTSILKVDADELVKRINQELVPQK